MNPEKGKIHHEKGFDKEESSPA